MQRPQSGHARTKQSLWVLCLAAVTVATFAGEPTFQYDAARSKTGVVYHYEKSNLDGTHPTFVSVYRPTVDRIESLKTDKSARWGTHVVAGLNLDTFTVSSFRTVSIQSGPQREKRDNQLRVEMTIDDTGSFSGVTGDGSRLTGRIDVRNWHSYDFDFASLGAVFPFLVEPERTFTFYVGDPQPGPELPVEVKFLGFESYAGTTCRKYSIDGPGLEHRGGHLWVSPGDAHLVGFEIQLPDEKGYDSNKLILLERESISPERWECMLTSLSRCADNPGESASLTPGEPR